MNPMEEINIDKVVLNVGVGGPGEDLERGKNLLERLTGREPKETKARGRSEFGVSKGREIGAMVTLRDEEAITLLERVFKAKDGELPRGNFDEQGNLSIGIEEHVDLPETEYDPDIGILGFDVAVTLKRPGFSIKRKRPSKEVGDSHKITKEEAIGFIEKNFDVNIVD